MNIVKLIILDVDGVLTNGKKIYNSEGVCAYKTFCDKDFTAIKKFKASGVSVCFLSGDENINKEIAKNRNLDFYSSRFKKKEDFLPELLKTYTCSKNEVVFIGDDIFDLQLLKEVKYSFCPNDSCQEVKKEAFKILDVKGGDNVVMHLFDYLSEKNLLAEPSIEQVYALDKDEKF